MKESLERQIIKHQHALMVLASFITTMAFQAGITQWEHVEDLKKKKKMTKDNSMWRSLKERKKIKRKKR